MKNENWFRELTDLEVQNINGGRNGDGADRVREEKAMAQQQKAMKDAADFAKKYNTNVGCTSKPLQYSEAGCGYIGLGVGTAAGAFAATTGVGAGAVGLIGNAAGMAATNACNSGGKGGSIGGSCSSSSSSSHCSSNGGFGGGSCSW